MQDFNEVYSVLIHNIVWLRKKNGFTMEEMAEKLNIDIDKLNIIENENRLPNVTVELFHNIKKHFNISVGDILNIELK